MTRIFREGKREIVVRQAPSLQPRKIKPPCYHEPITYGYICVDLEGPQGSLRLSRITGVSQAGYIGLLYDQHKVQL